MLVSVRNDGSEAHMDSNELMSRGPSHLIEFLESRVLKHLGYE